MAEWIWDGFARCWESDGRKIYATERGGFVIADEGGWMPGNYDSREAAELAVDRDIAFLQSLQDRKNEEARGAGGVITLADLVEEAKSGHNRPGD